MASLDHRTRDCRRCISECFAVGSHANDRESLIVSHPQHAAKTMKPPLPVRPLRLGTAYFFDTNFLVLPQEILPKVSDVPVTSRWVTETTRQEVVEQLDEQSARELVDGDSGFAVLRFNDLYREDPKICPVYYWYVLSMYNPANIGSNDFFEEYYLSMTIRGQEISDALRKAHGQVRKRSSTGHLRDPSGEPKHEFLRHLEDMQSRTSKKGRKSVHDGHPAYLRDIRTLSLILYNTLTTKKNTVFYTTDVDPAVLLLKWLASMSMRLALITSILPKIDRTGCNALMGGAVLEFFIDYGEFARRRMGMLKDLIGDQWKESGVRLTIRRWNQVQKSFDEDIWLTFPDDVADTLSNLHGNLWCHFTANDNLGNWLHFHYYWPPEEPTDIRIRVEVKTKSRLNVTTTLVPPEAHDDTCAYRRDDVSGKICSWSEFV